MTFDQVVVLRQDDESPNRATAVATALAEAIAGKPTELTVATSPDASLDEQAVEIIAACPVGSLLVCNSEHASRWSGKKSMVEHIIDHWNGPLVVVGPGQTSTAVDDLASGPILAALDGSPEADQVLSEARWIAELLGVNLIGATVVPDNTETPPSTIHGDRRFVVGNDPISALSQLAEDLGASMLALVSKGSRETAQRRYISRTSTGLIAECGRPVFLVRT